MSHIDPTKFLPNDHLQRLVADGELTQLHRGSQYVAEGDTFEIDGKTFEVTSVTEETLGDITDEDARREGAEDLDDYRQRLKHTHQNFEWDDDSETVCHRFERIEE